MNEMQQAVGMLFNLRFFVRVRNICSIVYVSGVDEWDE
jgi:hypothetical protein